MSRHTGRAVLLAILSLGVLSSGCSDSSHPSEDGGALDASAESKPDGTAPDGTNPDTADPDTADPDATKPDVTDPDATKPDVTKPDVTDPDVVLDVTRPDSPLGPDGDASTCNQLVWTSDSVTLKLTISGGLPTPSPCHAPTTSEFSPGARLLSVTGCVLDQSVHRVVHLTVAETDRLMLDVTALRTSCDARCGADAPNIKLTLLDAGACVRSAYDSDFYSGCNYPASTPPYVTFDSVSRLSSSFSQTVAAACGPDAGGADVGTCDGGDGGSPGICGKVSPPMDVVTDSPLDTTPSDADLDAGGDTDGSLCGDGLVWRDDSVSFTFTLSGGQTTMPPDGSGGDGGCWTQAGYYEFSSQTKSLVHRGCRGGRDGRRELELTDSQVDEIVAYAKKLRAHCVKTSCAADAPDMTLAVRDCSGRSEALFNSDFYSGCPDRQIEPPYIDWKWLFGLQGTLEGAIAASCDGVDAGSTGTCSPLCRQSFR